MCQRPPDSHLASRFHVFMVAALAGEKITRDGTSRMVVARATNIAEAGMRTLMRVPPRACEVSCRVRAEGARPPVGGYTPRVTVMTREEWVPRSCPISSRGTAAGQDSASPAAYPDGPGSATR